jgi:Asp-tRNA(Asn)/Glu-tRNA(Gln) amidotransferase A subunit family amidase
MSAARARDGAHMIEHDGRTRGAMRIRDYNIDDCVRAIHRRNGELNALLRVLDEPQRDPSVTKDAPLYGVPYVLKDTWDTAGIITTGGSWRHRDRVPRESGSIHRVLAKAGAVMLGKSNLPDLALSNESDNHLVGATKNPLDPTRTAGGSTGGGAAAVATGMAAFDWGGDFGGSIRTPAACCGIAGLRLSSASWPASNEQFPALAPFFLPMLGMGPLAATVEGCRTVMRAARALRADYGTPTMRADDVVVYAPDERTLCEWPTFVSDVASRLMAARVRLDIDRTLPPPTIVNELFNQYLCAHLDEFASTGELPTREAVPAVLFALASNGKLDRRVHTNTAAILALAQAGNLTIYRDVKRADTSVAALRAGTQAIWGKGRLIVAPTATIAPPLHGRALFSWTWQAFTRMGNLTDATAIAIPFGRFKNGLPRSIQIMGPPGSEEAVLTLAAKLEALEP